jgi:hypothetical protein
MTVSYTPTRPTSDPPYTTPLDVTRGRLRFRRARGLVREATRPRPPHATRLPIQRERIHAVRGSQRDARLPR